MGDVFRQDDSGFAVTLFAFAGTAGPAFGPLVCGWIAMYKGWRWIFWVNLIVWMTVWVVTLFTLKESKESILIQRRAARIRKEKNDSRYYAQEEVESKKVGYTKTFLDGIKQPVKLLFTEAIVFSMVRSL